jgi:hypothetical protein
MPAKTHVKTCPVAWRKWVIIPKKKGIFTTRGAKGKYLVERGGRTDGAAERIWGRRFYLVSKNQASLEWFMPS